MVEILKSHPLSSFVSGSLELRRKRTFFAIATSSSSSLSLSLARLSSRSRVRVCKGWDGAGEAARRDGEVVQRAEGVWLH